MSSQSQFEIDHIPTSQGDLEITFLGHGSLYLAYADKNIYVDPYSKVADYSRLPKADLVLSTHEHFDHLDPQALGCIRTDQTTLILNPVGETVIRNQSVASVHSPVCWFLVFWLTATLNSVTGRPLGV